LEETREQQKLHGFLQCLIYVTVALEVAVFIYIRAPIWGILHHALYRISLLPFYSNLVYSKLVTLGLICLVSIGTVAKKEVDLEPKKHIVYPLVLGLLFFFGSLFCYGRDGPQVFAYTTWWDLTYLILSFGGALITSIAMDN